MEEKRSRTNVDNDHTATGRDQTSTGFPPDPFASLIDGSVLTAPTQILGNCVAGLANPLPKGIGPVQTVEKSSVYDRGLQDDDGSLNQQKTTFPEGLENFRRFNARYLIGEEIGNGGMGQVYRGWDLNLQRYLAIKIIRKDYEGNAQHLFRFLREARIASKLGHPSVCACKRSCPPRFKTREHHDWCLTIDLTIGSQTNKGFRSWNRAETLGG
jgi:hypothetical protein